MVAPLELVFYDNKPPGCILSNKVYTELTRRLFTVKRDQIQVQCVIDNIYVVLKPCCEIQCLMLPYIP